MPQQKKGTSETEIMDGDPGSDRLSSGTENYLLCLYKLWEDSEIPTITQLTDTLKQLPPTELKT